MTLPLRAAGVATRLVWGDRGAIRNAHKAVLRGERSARDRAEALMHLHREREATPVQV